MIITYVVEAARDDKKAHHELFALKRNERAFFLCFGVKKQKAAYNRHTTTADITVREINAVGNKSMFILRYNNYVLFCVPVFLWLPSFRL